MINNGKLPKWLREVIHMFKIDNDRVRALLLQNGLPLSTFAEKCGLNPLTVKRTLKAGASATIKTISTLAKVFGVPADELILKT